MPNKRAIFYCRVSTHDQTTQNQLEALQKAASFHNWDVVTVIQDEGISGAKGREARPGFDRLCQLVTRREADIVAVWSLDRVGRSLTHLVEFMGLLNAKGVDLYVHNQNIDTTTPTGRLMFHLCGAFAEFERELIRERVAAGLARAKLKGTKSGAAIGRPKVPDSTREAIRSMRGQPIRHIAKAHGVSVGTVVNLLKD